MKNLTFLIIALLFTQITAISQPCLPEGIWFGTQAKIDSFQIYYPNCTEIEGYVTIQGDDITNLNGLNVLTAILGNFSIGVVDGGNPILTSLTGLDNLTSIGGHFSIFNNEALTSLTGLSNVVSIGGHFRIEGNPALTNLTGLDNLTSIGGCLEILHNDDLTSLTGLYSVTSIGENLSIYYNEALTSLTGLSNVVSIGVGLYIYGNEALTSLTGLSNVVSIMGDLNIWGNPSLTSLTGLGNVTSIGGDFYIGNNEALTSLTGLDNLTSIGGYLWIGAYWPDFGNIALTSLTGLSNVVSIGGALVIEANTALISLAGLDNIDAASINNLRIWANTSLSTCEVQSICNYLASPNGTIQIWVNAQGCNSQTEVEQACLEISVEELETSNYLVINPNPFSTDITIEYELKQPGNTVIKIYNQMGQLIEKVLQEEAQMGKSKFIWQANNLPSGIYFVRLQTGKKIVTKRIIKLR